MQEIALRSPRKLLSLTLQNTAQRFNLDADPDIAAWRDQRFHLAETAGMAAVAQMEPPMPPPPHMPAERLAETAERLSRMSVDAFIGAWNGLTGWRGLDGRGGSIQTPTLLIYGDVDAPPILRGMEALAGLIPQATVKVIAETGHSPQWERPGPFNAALRAFIESDAAVPRRGAAG